MTSERRFEGDLPGLLADLAMGSAPDYRDDILRRVARVRQRPAWTFPERWIPMAVLSRRPPIVLGMPLRSAGLAATLLMLLLLGAALALSIGSRPRLPAPFGPAGNGQIVFASNDDILARSSLASVDQILIGGPERDGVPIFSRQGDRLLFLRNMDTPQAELMVAAADGGGIRSLGGPFGQMISLEWNPTGSAIAVVSVEPGVAGGEDRPYVTIVPVDGRSPIRLDVPFPAQDVRWRPGSDELLVRGSPAEGPGFYLVRPDGSALRRLAIDADPVYGVQYDFMAPTWSHDGSRLLFVHLDTVLAAPDLNGFRIHVADVDPAGAVTSERALEFDPEADDELNATWAPGGDQFVFQRREGSSDTLHVGTLEGRELRQLGDLPSGGEGIVYTFAPDGRSIVGRFFAERTLWTWDVSTGAGVQLDLPTDDMVDWQRKAP